MSEKPFNEIVAVPVPETFRPEDTCVWCGNGPPECYGAALFVPCTGRGSPLQGPIHLGAVVHREGREEPGVVTLLCTDAELPVYYHADWLAPLRGWWARVEYMSGPSWYHVSTLRLAHDQHADPLLLDAFGIGRLSVYRSSYAFGPRSRQALEELRESLGIYVSPSAIVLPLYAHGEEP
jgi:hypothetical protein